jgi:murine toxin
MSEIDSVVQKIGQYFHHQSGDNYIRILDTPHVWGLPFGRAIMDQAWKRQAEFERALKEIVQKTRYRCDLASLNSPDPDWIRAVVGGIDTCMSTHMGRTQAPQFRFLFGQTPTVPVGEPANFTELKAALVRLVRDRSAHWELMPEFWVGRFYRLEEGILSALQAKVFGSSVIGSDGIKMTWNHSKIIAVDGVEALVGGHNLNMDLFRSYPPVHDVSTVVHGDAAYGSQLYLNQMWQCGTDLLTKESLKTDGLTWKNRDKDRAEPRDPLAAPAVQDAMKQRQNALLALHRSGKQTGTDTPAPAPAPQPSGTRENDLQTLVEINAPVFEERVVYNTYEGFDEYKAATRVLSLGKYWTGPDYQSASEVMKEQLIKGAKGTIKMSQMDLISAWKKNWSDHVVCQWILEALLANPNLKVQVVVSPLDAGAGAEGDQYSFGSGAVRTYALMEYYMTHDVATDTLLPDPEGKRKQALKRLEIAPLYYTDQVPSDKTIEGNTYKWPNLSPEGYTATLKQPPLSEKPPKKGVIGSAAMAVINASGYIYDKVPSAPGNHAKIMIVDDEAYVIGSDNLYPGFLSEFDYLVEGKDAVKALIDSYWTPLWKYSGPHCINAQSSHGYTRTSNQVGGSGAAFSDTPPEGQRLTRLLVHSGDVIDAIQATYGGKEMPLHGGKGGKANTIDLAEGEYITEISGKFGNYFGAVHILELSIRTNRRALPTYGSTRLATNPQPFSFKAESGEAIIAFSGRTFQHTDGTNYVSALGVVFQG